MDNIRFDEFFLWLKTTKYNGPVELTAKFNVKSDQVQKYCEISKNNVVGVRLFKRHAYFNNPSIFWIIQEWETVTDLKNHYLCETYIKNMELIMDTLEEPILQSFGLKVKSFELKYCLGVWSNICPKNHTKPQRLFLF